MAQLGKGHDRGRRPVEASRPKGREFWGTLLRLRSLYPILLSGSRRDSHSTATSHSATPQSPSRQFRRREFRQTRPGACQPSTRCGGTARRKRRGLISPALRVRRRRGPAPPDTALFPPPQSTEACHLRPLFAPPLRWERRWGPGFSPPLSSLIRRSSPVQKGLCDIRAVTTAERPKQDLRTWTQSRVFLKDKSSGPFISATHIVFFQDSTNDVTSCPNKVFTAERTFVPCPYFLGRYFKTR